MLNNTPAETLNAHNFLTVNSSFEDFRVENTGMTDMQETDS